MKLITETRESDIQVISEEKNGKRTYYIEGIFLESEVKNRNGRIYPKNVLSGEVNRFTEELVESNRAMGELGHPDGPTINLERVSHVITELKEQGNNFVGRAKVLDTPMGKIAKNFIDEKIRLGVSSRGMGSIKSGDDGTNIVKEDFRLATIDIVADPSAPNAFVNGIMEGKEWVWDNGVVKEVVIDGYKKTIQKASKKDLEERKLMVFNQFLQDLSKA